MDYNVSSPRCKIHRSIPSFFFSLTNDQTKTVVPKLFPIQVTIADIVKCKSSGCPLCYILFMRADYSFVPKSMLDKTTLALRRAVMGPEEGIQLCIGMDDITFTHFSRVPQSWYLSPPVKLDEPWDQLTVMRNWLSTCDSTHSKCMRSRATNLPKRLLDVKAFDNSKDVKLVESNNIPDATRYLTLSHCWGSPELRPICTTKATLSHRMQRIQFENLSLTFQDAVRITRDLNQRYLWIDSLCIIQDDGQDWKEQAAKMASIYGGSYLTIAALSSANSTEGCRIQTDRFGARCQDFDFSFLRVRLFETPPDFWDSSFASFGSTNPLGARGWTLQERALSLRSIHFAERQLLWECQTIKGSSELPWQETIQKYDIVKSLPLRLHDGEDDSPEGPISRRDSWYGLAEDFCSRSLSEETDKLPALAGLASNFYEQNQPGIYLAGIWSKHLPSALLWRTMSHDESDGPEEGGMREPLPRRPREYRAPSWSWASLDGGISYESQRVSGRGKVWDFLYRDFEILGLDDQFDAPFDPLGTLVTDSLLFRGQVTQIDVGMEVIKMMYDGRSFRPLLDNRGRTVGAFYPDIMRECRNMQSVSVIKVRAEPSYDAAERPGYIYEGLNPDMEEGDLAVKLAWELSMGLALQRTGSTGVYNRVGLVRWVLKRVFDGIATVNLKVV